MSSKIEDLRTIRTKKRIKDAFLDLMRTIGLEKITVQDLTQAARINRSTFYLHYKDKLDLLDQIEEEVLNTMREITGGVPTILKETKDFSHEQPVSRVIRLLTFVYENQQFFKLILCEKGDPSFIYKMGDVIRNELTKSGIKNQLLVPEHYVIAFVTGVQSSLIGEWINRGMKESPEEFATLITHFLKDIPKQIFK